MPQPQKIAAYALLLLLPMMGRAQSTAQQADSLLRAERYLEALPLWEQLHRQQPDNPAVVRSLAICHLYGTRRYDAAEALLAQAQPDDAPEVHSFYLAEVYRLTYRFEQAAQAYRRAGGREDAPYAHYCDNGLGLTRYVYTPNVLDTKRVHQREAHCYYSLAPQGGGFAPVPDDLLTEADRQRGHQPLMFFPQNPQTGDAVYFASYGRADHKDIHRTILLPDGRWSEPEPLPSPVNTEADEVYPYPSPDGRHLYFASNSPYGMGGYDLYRTAVQPTADVWTAPENLGFPVNSPADDYLFVPTSIDTLVLFCTNRNVSPDSVQVVLMTIKEQQVMRTATSAQQVAQLARLSRSPQRIAAPTSQPKRTDTKPAARTKAASFGAVESDPEYTRTLAKGFDAQQQADSLRERLEKLREKFDDVETAEQRIALEKRVFAVEERMLNAQKQADNMFMKASQIEQEYLTGRRKPTGRGSSSFTSDNPDYIYQAQFAGTVFQDNELQQLAKAEELQSELQKLRKQGLAKRERYAQCLDSNGAEDCADAHKAMHVAMERYIGLLGRYFEQKHPIYNDCMPVAIVKSGAHSDDVRQITTTATSHLRAASTIVNHLAEEGRVESLFEASMLRELALLRMDYVFAHVWGMGLMEQKLAQRVAELDIELFGSAEPMGVAAEEPQPVASVSLPSIERIERGPSVRGMSVKRGIPDDFGVVDTMVYSDANPIPIIKQHPQGVVYRIQIGAFGTPRQPKFFKNMVPVVGIRAGQVTKYYIGCLRTYAEAEKALQTVKERGFKDAFVAVWYNGKTVGVNRAKQLEAVEAAEATTPAPAATAEDDDRIYVVQIGVYQGAMPSDVLKTVRTLVAGKEVSRKTDAQGRQVYTVGSFKSAQEAEKVRGNLVASGLLAAEVLTIDL